MSVFEQAEAKRNYLVKRQIERIKQKDDIEIKSTLKKARRVEMFIFNQIITLRFISDLKPPPPNLTNFLSLSCSFMIKHIEFT